LLNAFDAVCVQGPWERERARAFHGVPEERIVALGSAWFRHLDLIRRINRTAAARAPDEEFVLYAGVSSRYFPRESEFAGVDAIHSFLERSGSPYRLVYRPFEMDETERDRIRCRYEGRVVLQWPSQSEGGLSEYSAADQEAALRRHVENLTGCRLLVMSSVTSIALDVAFLEDCPAVANWCDPTGTLQRRHMHLYDRSWAPALRVAESIPELFDHVAQLLGDRATGAAEAQALLEYWDFPAADFESDLLRAVTGESKLVSTS
jgi:hypothetical protein